MIDSTKRPKMRMTTKSPVAVQVSETVLLYSQRYIDLIEFCVKRNKVFHNQEDLSYLSSWFSGQRLRCDS